jgi:hypothetical protein
VLDGKEIIRDRGRDLFVTNVELGVSPDSDEDMSSPSFIPSLSTSDVDQAVQVSYLMAPPVSFESSHSESVNSTGIRAVIDNDLTRTSEAPSE